MTQIGLEPTLERNMETFGQIFVLTPDELSLARAVIGYSRGDYPHELRGRRNANDILTHFYAYAMDDEATFTPKYFVRDDPLKTGQALRDMLPDGQDSSDRDPHEAYVLARVNGVVLACQSQFLDDNVETPFADYMWAQSSNEPLVNPFLPRSRE